MGLWLIRKGRFAEAEPYLRKAVEVLTERNPNPYDGEPLYNLGLSLKYQGRDEEAYDCFYKACWNAAWQDAGYFSLAQLSQRPDVGNRLSTRSTSRCSATGITCAGAISSASFCATSAGRRRPEMDCRFAGDRPFQFRMLVRNVSALRRRGAACGSRRSDAQRSAQLRVTFFRDYADAGC